MEGAQFRPAAPPSRNQPVRFRTRKKSGAESTTEPKSEPDVTADSNAVHAHGPAPSQSLSATTMRWDAAKSHEGRVPPDFCKKTDGAPGREREVVRCRADAPLAPYAPHPTRKCRGADSEAS